jgi:hypothetical protein
MFLRALTKTCHAFECRHHKLAVADRVELIPPRCGEFIALTISPDSVLPPICANRTADGCPFLS